MRLPTFYLCHGGGPWPWFGGSMRTNFDLLELSLINLIPSLNEIPKAILVISGHWEETKFSVTTHPNPPMLYDYYGFPEFAYQIKYNAPGSPVLAAQIMKLLAENGIDSKQDKSRGFDHGTFTLMYPMRPEGDIPIVQMSVKNDYSVDEHLKLGRILSSLRDEGVLIIGSGMTYHNLSLLGEEGRVPSYEFNLWLRNNLVNKNAKKRAIALNNWETAPFSRVAHSNPDHLFPLMVAAGAGEDGECSIYFQQDNFFKTIAVTSFRFG